MPLSMKSDRFEMVDSWEIRIGNESLKHHFGRRVPITQAIEKARAWLDTIDNAGDRHG